MTDIHANFGHEIELARVESARVVSAFYESLSPYVNAHSSRDPQSQQGVMLDSITMRVKYHDYPFLFVSLFGPFRDAELINLAIAGQLYAESVVLVDKLMDGQVKSFGVEYDLLLLSYQHRLQRALELFHRLFDVSSPFWAYLHRYSREHAAAVLLEKNKHNGCWASYPEHDMTRIAKGKQALAKIIPTALALLSGSEHKLSIITESQDQYAMGLQFYDDLIDWRKDYQAKRYSYLLARVLESAGANAAEPRMATTQVGRHLYLSGLADRHLNEADSFFEAAVRIMSGHDCPNWVSYIQKTQSDVRVLRKDLMRLSEWLVKKARVVNSSQRVSAGIALGYFGGVGRKGLRVSIAKAVRFLVEQQQDDYPEAQHLELAREEGISHETYCQWGDVFNRALILDALLDAEVANFPINPTIIRQEIDKIVTSKLAGTRTGWSYFPRIRTLPADADDLGQVVQVLAKSNFDRLREVCEEPIQLLVNHNRRPDGALDTWISDPEDLQSLEMKSKMQALWGSDPDVEVVANALYGVYLYDQRRFGHVIRSGISYLVGRQHPDGYWESSWYYGKYYGTYVCLRIIAALSPDEPSVAKALRFIKGTQNRDGGWGVSDSNANDTAVALLATLTSSCPDYGSVTMGTNFLLSSQGDGGNWPPSDFIKIDLTRMLVKPASVAREEPLHESLAFKSSTVSTSLCVRALIHPEELWA